MKTKTRISNEPSTPSHSLFLKTATKDLSPQIIIKQSTFGKYPRNEQMKIKAFLFRFSTVMKAEF